MRKILSESIMITSCDGISVEISKNLSLMGSKSLVILDDKTIRAEDLSTNFLLNEMELELSKKQKNDHHIKNVWKKGSKFCPAQ